jgi:hypothetical protein
VDVGTSRHVDQWHLLQLLAPLLNGCVGFGSALHSCWACMQMRPTPWVGQVHLNRHGGLPGVQHTAGQEGCIRWRLGPAGRQAGRRASERVRCTACRCSSSARECNRDCLEVAGTAVLAGLCITQQQCARPVLPVLTAAASRLLLRASDLGMAGSLALSRLATFPEAANWRAASSRPLLESSVLCWPASEGNTAAGG